MVDIADTADSIGKFKAMTTFFSMIVVYSIALIISIIIFLQKPIEFGNTNGVVKSVNYFNKKYNVNVDYTINNVNYNSTIISTGRRYNVNQNIIVFYQLNNPTIIYDNKPLSNKTFSLIFIVIAAILLGISYLNYYLSQNSRNYSMYLGASAMLGR